MAAEPTLVGLDVGTTGVKAIAVSPSGAVLASATRGYPLSTPRPGWSEQDPEDWWEAAAAALAEVSAGRSVAGIGLSGQMHGLVVLDADGARDPSRPFCGTTSGPPPSASRSRSAWARSA